ncbi:MAG: hypothetical protein ABJZ55_25765 [Fuerstiella sp.]
MAGLSFCLNRRQGTASTAVICSNELQPGYRIQVREKRVYGQIWEGTVDGSQLCGQAAFVGLRAILNVPADCPSLPSDCDERLVCPPPVMSGCDPVVVTVVGDPTDPVEPVIEDPPMAGWVGSAPDTSESNAGPCSVDLIVVDYNGRVVSCDECVIHLFP